MSQSQAVLERIERWRDDIIGLTCDLIATPSPTPPGDERAVAQLIADRLAKLGLPGARLVGPTPERQSVLFRLSGTGGGQRIALNGHIDTKPIGDASKWLTDPLAPTFRDGQLYGLGSSDMKAGVAAMIYAVAAIHEVVQPLRGDILLVLTADEEGGCAHGAQYLLENKLIDADAVLIGEPAGIREEWEYLHVVSRGLTAIKVSVYGTQGHSSISDVLPQVNANVVLAEILVRFAREFSIAAPSHPYAQQGVTVNAGVVMRGGVHYGITPGYAEFGSDIRIPPGVQIEDVEHALNAFFDTIRSDMPGVDVRWAFEPPPLRWHPTTEIATDNVLVQAVVHAAQQVLGKVPPFGTFPGGTEAMLYQGHAGIPALPAFGPGFLPVAHGPNEHVGVESIVQAAKMYALAAAEACA